MTTVEWIGYILGLPLRITSAIALTGTLVVISAVGFMFRVEGGYEDFWDDLVDLWKWAVIP